MFINSYRQITNDNQFINFLGGKVALNKIQSIIEKFSKDPKVKKVISEVQSATKDIQSKIHNLNKEEAMKTYKQLLKKVSSKENELQKEVKTIITKVKKSATEVEKNLKNYKKQADAKRSQLEKMLKAKTAGAAKTAPKTKRAAPKKKSAAKK